MVTTPSNMDVVSNIEGFADAQTRIKELANINTETVEGKEAYIKVASEIAFEIDKNNKNASGDNRISDKDKTKLFNMLAKKMGDANFREQFKNLPDLNGLKAIELQQKTTNFRIKNWKNNNLTEEEINEQKQDVATLRKLNKEASVLEEMENTKRRTAEAVLDYATAGDFENAHKVYKAGLQKAIRTKYWYIPELQNENLQAGTKFTVNGKVYTFQGYSSKDMIVEVN